MNLTLEYHRSPARYLAGRAATSTRLGSRAAGVLAANLSPLRLLNRPDPRRPGPDWGRVRPILSGICGSDLALLTGRNSPYLSAVVSMPAGLWAGTTIASLLWVNVRGSPSITPASIATCI